MADKKITELTALAVAPADDDLFTLVDVSEVLTVNQNKKISWATMKTGITVTGQALTKTDDTNVTLTLGGSPTTALVNASSITVGWTGQLALSRGGTNKNMTAVAGGVVWTDADSMEVIAAGTTGQALISGGTGAPTWFAPTAGSVIFAGPSGILAQDNAVLFYDDTNNFFGVGINSSLSARVHVVGTGNSSATFGLKVDNSDSSHSLHWRNDGVIMRNGVLFSKAYSATTTTWGALAGNINTGASNTFIGANAGLVNIGTTNNTFVGESAGAANIASSNTFIGKSAGAANTTGTQQVIIGVSAGSGVTTGTKNTLVGYHAGEAIAAGGENIMIGNNAGKFATGSHNILLGSELGVSSFVSGSSNIVIGNGALGTSNTVNACILLGNNTVANGRTNSIGIGHGVTLTADNQIVYGYASIFFNQILHYWSATEYHGTFFRTTTPEGNQAAYPGSICYVSDGTNGEFWFKSLGTGAYGWEEMSQCCGEYGSSGSGGGGSVDCEDCIDEFGAIFQDSTTIDFTYDGLGPTLTASVIDGSITAAKLAAMTSAELAGKISDETGTGLLVFATNPTLSGITMADATNIVLNTGTGTKIGTATSQKLAFFNSTPVIQQSGSIVTGLNALGLVVSGTVTSTDVRGAANTFIANNTGSTANYTERVYKNVDTSTYAGTFTWDGTPPTTIVSQQYGFTHMDGMCHLWLNVVYTSAGAANTQLIATLPSDAPTPITMAGMGDAASEIITQGTGAIATSVTAAPPATRLWLRKNAANNGYELVITQGSIAGLVARFFISYRTA